MSIEVAEGRDKLRHSRLRFSSSLSSTKWSRSRAKCIPGPCGAGGVGHHFEWPIIGESDWGAPLKPMHARRVFDKCSFIFTVPDARPSRPTHRREKDVRLREGCCEYACLGTERIRHRRPRRWQR